MPFQPKAPYRLLPALLLLAACADTPSAVIRDSVPDIPAPTTGTGPSFVPGRYIVVLKAGASSAADVAQDVTAGGSGQVHFVYRRVLRGFAASLNADGLQAAKNHPDVAFIEPDGVVRLLGTQTSAPWNLSRIDQRDLPTDGNYTYAADGTGVTVYVIDTGVRTTHTQFGGRATAGYDATNDSNATLPTDCNGHGTHVAGTVAGTLYGVAKGATVVAVKVFQGCSSSTSWSYVIEGVDWVTQNAVLPAVANMSLGGDASGALDSAIEASIDAGITYVVAAGNDNVDACAVSPARTPTVISVGASSAADAQASFSNWGPCVDLFAPGVSILSSYISGSSNVALATSSGTSMASPHVAGAAALWLESHPTDSPAEVAAALLDATSLNRLTDVPHGTTNALLFTGFTAEAGARLGLDRQIVEFRYVRAGPGFAPRPSATPDYTGPLVLTNTGTASVSWTAESNRSWLTFSPASGTLAPGASQTLTLTASATRLPQGTYEALLRISDPGAINTPAYATVRFHILSGGTLAYGVPHTGIWGDVRDPFRYYRLDVLPGVGTLTLATSGGNGDMDLYVEHGAVPTEVDFSCRSINGGSIESCVITNPPAGEWWVMLHAYAEYEGASLTASMVAAPTPGRPVSLTATLVVSGVIDVAWVDNSSTESRFVLQWRQRPVGGSFPTTWNTIAPSPPANVTTYQHTGRAANTEYQYRVKACHTYACSSYRTGNIVATPP